MASSARPLPSRQTRAFARFCLLATLASAAALAGCDSGDEGLTGTVYIYLGLTEDQELSAKMVASKRARAQFFIRGFQREHPGVKIQLQFYPEIELADRLRTKNRGGQGPDLLLVNAGTAQLLYREELTRPVQANKEVQDQLAPETLAPLRDGSENLIGLPFVFEPQLACFNKKLLKQAPGNLVELLEASDARPGIGAPLKISGLYWSLGSLGATQGFNRLLRNQKLDDESRAALRGWLQWLQKANTHAGMYFYLFPDRMVNEFSTGKVSWVPCRSPFIREFENELGDSFGVAPLPRGPGGKPSPLSDMRVWAFGVNSSANQKKIAEKLAAFSINPLVQFRISLDSDEVLPINRKVVIPVQRSLFLQTLKAAHQSSPPLSKDALNYRSDPALQDKANKILGKLLYGDLTPEKTLDKLEQIFQPETPRGP